MRPNYALIITKLGSDNDEGLNGDAQLEYIQNLCRWLYKERLDMLMRAESFVLHSIRILAPGSDPCSVLIPRASWKA